MRLNPITIPWSVAVILNRRTLLATIGLALPAAGAEAATLHHKKKKPTHAIKTASVKSHHKAVHSHTHTTPTQS
jgi:hypothetical protein